mgnify:CR=1 FL=1
MKKAKLSDCRKEWSKFKLWCQENKYSYKIPGEYAYMDTRNANIALLIDFGKVRLLRYTGLFDAEFEMVEEVELLPEKEK